ncbi:MAG TPA: hypothetical protein VGR47_20460 [Terracidiphilus sp.]|nr:hypothetical protein [Terracidiphilus sp.]
MKILSSIISSLIGPSEEPKPIVAAEATAEDHQEFVTYLRQKFRPFRKAGMTIDDEFKAWVADRASKRAAAAALAGAPAETTVAVAETEGAPVAPAERLE